MGRRPLCLLCSLLMVFLFFLHLFGVPLLPDPPGAERADAYLDTPYTVTVTGRVVSSEAQEDYSICILKQTVLSVKSEKFKLNRVRLSFKIPRHYAVGTVISARGILEKVTGATNPGQFDKTLYYRVQNIGYTMKNPDVTVLNPSCDYLLEGLALLRETAAQRIRTVYPADVSGVLGAMLTGSRSMLSLEEKSRYQMGGISHMLAISGLHISLLGMGVFNLLRKMRLGMKPAAFVSTGLLLLYAILTGMSVSTLRAFIMFALVMGAKLSGRTYDSFTAAALAAILILIDNPYYLFYSGFQLSFLAVTVCAFFRKRSRLMLGILLYFCTLPLVLLSFYEIPLYGILINFAAVPLLPFVLGFGILGTVLGGVFVWPAVLCLRFYDFLLSLAQKMPASSLILGKPSSFSLVVYGALLVSFLVLSERWRLKKKRFWLLLMLPLMVGIFALRPRTGLEMTFIDVGQGDGCLIESPGGLNILVDSGSSTAMDVGTYRVLPLLKCRGVRKLDYIFATHMDSDHIGGIKEILTAVRDRTTSLSVGTLVLPYVKERGETYREMQKLAKEAGVRVLTVQAGDSFIEGGEAESGKNSESKLNVRVLGPEPAVEVSPIDENAQCIVLSVSYGDFDALLTGDVSGAGEANLVKILRNQDKEYELLKVAHHGSKYSTPKELLDLIRPQMSVISVGKGNWYGHPHAELIKRLKASGTDIYETEYAGAVTVTSDGKGFRAEKFVNGQSIGTAVYNSAA